ncbi:unnamed protein product [Discosporangium mesarthrocarpum]
MIKKMNSSLAMVVLSVCACKTLGFVSPTWGRGAMEIVGTRFAQSAPSASAVLARPQSLPRLFSAPDGSPDGEGGEGSGLGGIGGSDMDVADMFSQQEMTVEDKVEALRREVQSQSFVADEEEANMSPLERAMQESNQDDDKIEKLGFQTDPDFVDEGKKIQWPNFRRAIQLTVLSIVAQVGFFLYIITLNAFCNSVPGWFGKFVEVIKGMDLPVISG